MEQYNDRSFLYRFGYSLIAKAPSDEVPQQVSMYFIWIGASGYLFLRQYESLSLPSLMNNNIPQVSFADIHMLRLIPIVTLIWWFCTSLLCGRRPSLTDARIALAGAVAAFGISGVSVGLLYGFVTAWEILISISIALLAIRLVPISPNNLPEMVSKEVMVGFAAFGLILTFLQTPITKQFLGYDILYGLLCLLVLLFIADTRSLITKADISIGQKKRINEISYILTPLLLLSAMGLGLSLLPVSVLTEGLRDACMFFTLLQGINMGTLLYITFARDAEKDQIDKKRMINYKNITYTRIVLLIIGLLMISILFSGQSNLTFSYIGTRGFYLILPFITICLILYFISRINNSTRKHHIISLVVLAIAYVILFLLVYWLREPVFTSAWDALLLLPVIGTSLFIANGIARNARLLCGISVDEIKNDRILHLLLCIIILGCIPVFILAILPSNQTDSTQLSVISPLIGILVLYISSCTLPRLAINAIGCPESGEVIFDAGFSGVKQDTRNSFLMISVAGLVVIHLVEWLQLQNSILGTLLTFVSFAGAAGVLIDFTLCNNSKHYQNTFVEGIFTEKEKKDEDVSNERRALREHLERQAHLVVITLLPYSLTCLLWTLRKDQLKDMEKNNDPFVVVAYNDYLLRLPGLKNHEHRVHKNLRPFMQNKEDSWLDRLFWR